MEKRGGNGREDPEASWGAGERASGVLKCSERLNFLTPWEAGFSSSERSASREHHLLRGGGGCPWGMGAPLTTCGQAGSGHTWWGVVGTPARAHLAFLGGRIQLCLP